MMPKVPQGEKARASMLTGDKVDEGDEGKQVILLAVGSLTMGYATLKNSSVYHRLFTIWSGLWRLWPGDRVA
jgi:hypothetical protein